MAKLIDLTGQRIGHLLVLERAENKQGRTQWKCKCDCGNIVTIAGGDLRHKDRPRLYCSNQCILKNKPIDLTGQRFGYLVAEKIFDDREHKYKTYGTQWICKCDCGKETIVQSGDLRSGKVKSCGCLRAKLLSQQRSIDLTGQKFGKLKVIKLLYSTAQGNVWQCLCDCGNIVNARAQDLKNGDKVSCGCVHSRGEMIIQHYLQILNIPYQKEYHFSDLRGPVNLLRFDFAVFDNNNNLKYLIEFDGIQHFAEHHWSNGMSLEEQQKRDNQKNEYCNLHHIPLIRFNYKELKNNILTLDYFKQKISNEITDKNGECKNDY